ncbi:hsc70-interacting protein-like [Saccostrea echinata]|uniref:hsc70-interacting protein-like n=1 Tax=Saccostrea echinata TaxID=191078 RepID=UPI002A834852|nr:hsc70-interacting protein-like [Saccostrea echinata]
MAEGGVPQEGEERLPKLEDFLNNEELRRLYQDPEVQMIFTEIENNPATIHHHHNHPKVQQVLRLIQSEFDRQPLSTSQGEEFEQMTRPTENNDDIDIEDIIKIIEMEENSPGHS